MSIFWHSAIVSIDLTSRVSSTTMHACSGATLAAHKSTFLPFGCEQSFEGCPNEENLAGFVLSACVCFVVDSISVLAYVLVFLFADETLSAGRKRRSWQVLFRRISLQINLWPASKEAGRAHICHKYHKLYLWRKIVMWRNFGKFWEILRLFGRFCHNLRAFMWRKIEPKKYICGEKMTNMRSGRAPLRSAGLVSRN